MSDGVFATILLFSEWLRYLPCSTMRVVQVLLYPFAVMFRPGARMEIISYNVLMI
jgi:hypothetical protein